MQNFKNLVDKKHLELNTYNRDLFKQLAGLQTTGEILGKWFFTDLLPAGKNCKGWEVEKLKTYLINRIHIKYDSDAAKFENTLLSVFNATKQITEITISVEWVKNRIWGLCPQATARVCYVDNTCDTFTSSRITGCGYDKESTAIAQTFNQCTELLNLLYAIKDMQPTDKNHAIFGYGSGYGLLPAFESGVGVDCYKAIFEKLGYSFAAVSHGKTFDVYKVVKN